LRTLQSLILTLALATTGANKVVNAATSVDTDGGNGLGADGTRGVTVALTSAATTDAADQSLPQPAAPDAPAAQQEPGTGILTDIKLYFTAPLRWDARNWAWFGGALLAVGAAHHYDTQVRTHFVKNYPAGHTFNSDDVQDLVPTVAVVGLTWSYATLADDSAGRRETGAMVEAAVLSTVTAYALKYIIAREGPDETSNPNEWFKGHGDTFPSFHATAAFAVGTVLAESGNDEYRWLRRLLGYGLGVVTSYERLKHNAHWFSDTVAGAAIGGATANFTMHRRYASDEQSSLSVVPVEGGAMLTYRLTLP
jgi:membrane-associated phospholipid phosphatase